MTYDPLCSGMLRVRPHHQPEKSQHHGPRCQYHPTISLGDHTLDVEEKFTYLGSTIFNNLSMDVELTLRIGRAATAMTRLAKRVWDNTMLTLNIKMRVHQTCVLSTFLYGSETLICTLTKSED